jgi:hypothetical protein
MTSDPHTIGWRVANADVGGVGDPAVYDAERLWRATLSELTSLFHVLCTSAVLLNDVEGSMGIEFRRKAKGSLAGTTTDRICVHGSQGDEDQRQKSVREDHGASVDGLKNW